VWSLGFPSSARHSRPAGFAFLDPLIDAFAPPPFRRFSPLAVFFCLKRSVALRSGQDPEDFAPPSIVPPHGAGCFAPTDFITDSPLLQKSFFLPGFHRSASTKGSTELLNYYSRSSNFFSTLSEGWRLWPVWTGQRFHSDRGQVT